MTNGDYHDVVRVSKYLLNDRRVDYLVDTSNIVVTMLADASIDVIHKDPPWCLIPRWILQTIVEFDENGGYAGLSLPEYLGKLVEESNV